MPRRNLHVILVAALVALLCHGQAQSRHSRALSQAYNLIAQRYVGPIDERELFVAALEGMTDQLDDHSRYFSPEDYAQFREALDKQFTGIGIQVLLDPETGQLTVVSPLLGGPALEAGMRAGDVILTVDGKELTGLELTEMVEHLKGPPGSVVELSVLHHGAEEPVSMRIRRAAVLADSVMGDTRHADGSWNFRLEEDPRIGYIRLDTFGDHTLSEFEAALDTFENDPIEGLILDLRGNSGGRLEVVIPLCNMFIDRNSQYGGVIVSTRGRDGEVVDAYRADSGGTIVPRDLPVAMLIDGGSASASEIFAACLQDYGRATIIGSRSYGKGTVQELIALEDRESELKLTTATYHRPSGENIDRHLAEAIGSDVWGVSPNEGFELELTDEETVAVLRWRSARDVIRFNEDGRTIAPTGLLPEEEVGVVVEEEPMEEEASQDEPVDEEPLDEKTVEEVIEEYEDGEIDGEIEIEVEAEPFVPGPVAPLSGHPDPQLELAVEFLQGKIARGE